MEIVLASRSPRRLELMGRLAEGFSVAPVDVDETRLEGEDGERFAMRLAALKAETAAASLPDAIVVGADTIVEVDGQILGKPASREDAKAMLELLSGRIHLVITGIALVHKASGRELVDRETTAVTFRPLAKEAIEEYLDRNDFRDKAGAYAIQDVGGRFVELVDGDYDNVVGFPVSRVSQMLAEILSPEPGAKT